MYFYSANKTLFACDNNSKGQPGLNNCDNTFIFTTVALTNDSNPVKDIVIKNATITVKRAFSQDMSLFSSKEVKSSP